MKKICFLIGNLNNSGGTERVTTTIANALCENTKNEIFILSLHGGLKPFFSLSGSVSIHSLYDTRPSFKKDYLKSVFKIRDFISTYKIDTLVVVDSISCVFTVPALIGLKVKHICWEHFNFKTNLGKRSRDLGRKLAAKYCDYVVTLTQKDKYFWENGIAKINAKIVPIANPTPYENIEHTPSVDNKTVLAVGRLTYQKGFDMLLKAWAEVAIVQTDWQLQIVGSGEDEAKLKKMAEDLNVLNSVSLIPANQQVTDYYKKASIFCLSSRYEGFPMVLLEAQTFGLPIVAFDCDTGPSDIIEHGKNGFLVEPMNVRELAEGLLKMMNLTGNEYNNLIEISREKSLNYSVDIIIKSWYKII